MKRLLILAGLLLLLTATGTFMLKAQQGDPEPAGRSVPPPTETNFPIIGKNTSRSFQSLDEERLSYPQRAEKAARPADDRFAIRLLARTIDTSTSTEYGTAGRSNPAVFSGAQKMSRRGVLPCLVQFSGPIRDQWKSAVETAGGRLKDYVPNNAFIVEIDPLQVEKLAAMADVQWIGEYRPEYKIQPFLQHLADTASTAPSRVQVTVVTFDPEDVDDIAKTIALRGGVVKASAKKSGAGKIRATVDPSVIPELATFGAVQWIEEFVEPRPHNNLAVQGSQMNVTNLWTTYGLNGTNQVIGHCDTGLDTGDTNTIHPDFARRIKAAYALGRTGDWSDPDGHGTHTAGSILGSGAASTGLYRGVAWAAQIVHQSVEDSEGRLSGIPTDLNTLFNQCYTNGARIHSDSWGSSEAGRYTSDSQDADEFMWNHQDMLIVFSASNDGVDDNSDGVVDADSMGAPGTAKNVLTVGASESGRPPGSGGYSSTTWYGAWPADYPANPIRTDYISQSDDGVNQGIAAFSSRGPTDDGRTKPDIVAPGTDIISCQSHAPGADTGWGAKGTNYAFMGGTSMSCPLTAGAAALVRQFLVEKKAFTNPSAALVKAIMVSGAKSLSPGQYGTGSYREIPALPRPNNVEGWGQVNLEGTLYPASPRQLIFFDGASLSTGGSTNYAIQVNSSTNLSVMLAYSDYPGTLIAATKLVNDLDLVLIGPAGATNYPNGLASADRLNPVEGIDLEGPATGAYTIRISGYNVPQSPQPFALVVIGDVSTNSAGTIRLETAAYEANESNGTVEVSLVREGGSFGSVQVDILASNGTALAGSDYVATNGTLSFADGVLTNHFSVQLVDDSMAESNEQFFIRIGNPAGGAGLGTPTNATVTVVDDDNSGTIEFSLDSYTTSEDTNQAVITVVRRNGSAGPVTLDFSTGDGTATAGSDYTATNGVLVFDSGTMSQTFSVTILNDTDIESSETVLLALSNIVGAAQGDITNALLTILDNDSRTNTVLYETFDEGAPDGWSVKDYQGSGAYWRFDNPGARTNLTGGSSGFAIADSAYYGFVLMRTDLITPALDFSEMSTVYVRFKSDFYYRTNAYYETAAVRVDPCGGTNWTVAWVKTNNYRGPVTETIDLTATAAGRTNVVIGFYYSGARNDYWWQVDEVEVYGAVNTNHGSFALGSANYRTAENGHALTVTVARSISAAGIITVDFAVTGGTAAAGLDYVPTNGTLTFVSGATSATFAVSILDDTVCESNKTVDVRLSPPSEGAALGTPSNAVITLMDNDGGTSRVVQASFDAGLPAGWTVLTNGDSAAYWRFDDPKSRGNLTGGSGVFAIADSDYAGSVSMDTELRSPSMNLAGLQTVTLEFKSDFHWYNRGGYEMAQVDLSSDGTNGPWQTVWDREGADYRGPTNETVDVTSLAAGCTNAMTRFHYYGANYDWWWEVDQVRVYGNANKTDSDGDGLPDWWEAAYGFATNIANGTNDPDNDQVSNMGEYLADTDPTDSNSVFFISTFSNEAGRAISFPSSADRNYNIDWTEDLPAGLWSHLRNNVEGTGVPITIVDTNEAGQRMYRIEAIAP